jgi:transcriptional regulator with XRE-family HTH domain
MKVGINMSLIARFDGNMNVIGRLLKEYRMEKDLSYEKLSAKLELMGISIHKQSLYDIENNKRTVKDYELFGLAYVLGIDINDLLADMRKNFKK